MSTVTILCNNCKVDILRANSDFLKTPLYGFMFTVKPQMEWSIFDGSATGNDLICPMCGWCFHDNGKLLTSNGVLDLNKKTPIVIEPEDIIQESVVTQILPKRKGWPKGKTRGKRK